MELNVKMSRGLNEKHVGEKEYRRSIGCLRYLLLTRRDLSFVVGMLSRYMHEPRESHNVLLKQVLQYLRGTLSYGLSYERADGMRLIGYSDSSHNADADDGRSTTGHIFYLEKCPITWCSQKQETVDLSSCEAEFMAATEAAKQAIWLQDLLAEVTGSRCEKVTLRIDNKSAIALTKNPMFHGRRKEQTHTPNGTKGRYTNQVPWQEMRSFIGVQELKIGDFKLEVEGKNVGPSLK
ncbi:secreted RxLR effector protein 161-like [Brassica rapa]|uniref:secreted RxLR effector protein 161-like n=1 Tax=Brassica campestris TaxID=3711 RepID=UPI00142D7C69|nr:secreted RxLR effector protein 161-like [Brassica rapa]